MLVKVTKTLRLIPCVNNAEDRGRASERRMLAERQGQAHAPATDILAIKNKYTPSQK